MSIPATLDEARSAEWLSSILDADVIDVAAGPVDQRVSTNAPVHVTLADGRTLDLWIKGYFGESLLRHAGVPEAHFYSELAHRAGLRTLRCLYADVDPATSDNVLVTEDVGGGATFPDGPEPLTPDLVAQSLAELAALHATTWLDPACASSPWLASRMSMYTVNRGLAEIRANFDGETGMRVPGPARDGERLIAAFRALTAEVEVADPWCVVHGDAHIRNIFIEPSGRPSFIDWQLVQRGPWYLDVGYHIASMLSIEDRRCHEGALVAEYLDRLVAAGIDRPDGAEVERGLRRSFVYGFYLWAITLRVDPLAIAAMLERLGTAVDDHDAFKELTP